MMIIKINRKFVAAECFGSRIEWDEFKHGDKVYFCDCDIDLDRMEYVYFRFIVGDIVHLSVESGRLPIGWAIENEVNDER